jgi:hypothetical protein
MDRSAKAVISQLLASDVTPVLKPRGFDRRGNTYERVRDGRHELIHIQPNKWNNRYGGSFTMNLGIFIPDVDRIASLYPLREAPREADCQVRCRIGELGRDGLPLDRASVDPWRGWWEFAAATDLSTLGTELRPWVEHNALRFFDNLSTGTDILARLRLYPAPPERVGLREVALAACLGGPVLAQQALDVVVAAASPGPNRMLRDAARIARRLGLAAPAPTDPPALTAVFQLAAQTPPRECYGAFHHLEYRLGQYDEPGRLYHTAECTTHACTVTFYGADPEDLAHRLRPAFDSLASLFTGITWQTGPAAGG